MSRTIRFGVAVLAALVGWTGDPTEAATLRGTVVAADGTPASGARIWAVNLRDHALDRHEAVADAAGRYEIAVGPGSWLTDATLGDQGMADAQQTATVAAADPAPVIVRLRPQGRLRVTLVEAETGRPVVGGRLVLDNGLDPSTDAAGRVEVGGLARRAYHEAVVVAPGRERFRVVFELADAPVTDLEVAVPRGAKVVGRVLDRAGGPVAGAWLGRNPFWLTVPGALWTRADAQGRFEYDGLRPGRTTRLVAEAEGFGTAEVDGIEPPPDGGSTAVVITLDRTSAADRVEGRRDVAGVVLDPEGRPVAARVRYEADDRADPVEAQADALGRFRFAAVPDGPGDVTAIPARPDLAPAALTVPEGDQEVRLVVAPGRTAAGVLRAAAGAPFPDVVMTPWVAGLGRRQLSLPERRARTDAGGRFAITGLPDLRVTANFIGPGLGSLRSQPLALDRETVVIGEPAGVILGRVVDGAGRPVRNFRVTLARPREGRRGDKAPSFAAALAGTGLTCTSADGTFLIPNQVAGAPVRVTVLAPGHGAEAIDRLVAEPPDRWTAATAARFEVGPPSLLEVFVQDAGSGRPVAAARVGLVFGDDVAMDHNFGKATSDLSWYDSAHARTDAAGLARFPALAFPEATVLIRAPGSARQLFGWRDAAATLTVRLQPEAIVEGVIRDRATGRPLVGATVLLNSREFGQITIPLRPEDGGRFRFDEVPPGDHSLLIEGVQGATLHREMITIRPGQRVTRDLRLAVPPK